MSKAVGSPAFALLRAEIRYHAPAAWIILAVCIAAPLGVAITAWSGLLPSDTAGTSVLLVLFAVHFVASMTLYRFTSDLAGEKRAQLAFPLPVRLRSISLLKTGELLGYTVLFVLSSSTLLWIARSAGGHYSLPGMIVLLGLLTGMLAHGLLLRRLTGPGRSASILPVMLPFFVILMIFFNNQISPLLNDPTRVPFATLHVPVWGSIALVMLVGSLIGDVVLTYRQRNFGKG